MMGSVALEEFELMKDAKYRLYVSAVDKALKAFENTNEWPDLISALGKLNKVIKEHQRFPVIPRRIKIGKRLAQCMHFKLPAGVHLKALEIYDTIFKCMGTNRLSHELFIYSAGLFPLLGPSAMLVKPKLLTVYETHFVPLGSRLLPGLSGFLSGVLPGLEEGSDHFDRTNALLEKVCEGVGPVNFYGCLWECIICNAAVRLPAVTFALAHFNKKIPIREQIYIIGPDIKVMVDALCAGMQDINVLVQRSSLDLLLMGFPMHSREIPDSDMIRLVTAALGTILRRDISLNRRLYSWLLGSELNLHTCEPSDDHLLINESMNKGSDLPQTYFQLYSRNLLIQGLKHTLKYNAQSPDMRPYRLITSLLDKPDVGPVILDDILFEIFRLLHHTITLTEDQPEICKRKQDILKSANLFFGSLESCYIWNYLGTLFEEACAKNLEDFQTISEVDISMCVKCVGCGESPNLWEVCELSELLIGIISPNPSCEHLINLLIRLVNLLIKYLDSFREDQLLKCLLVCRVLLKKMPISEDEDSDVITRSVFVTFIRNFEKFFEIFIGGNRILNDSLVNEAFGNLIKDSKNVTELLNLLNRVIADSSEDNEKYSGKYWKDPLCSLISPKNSIWIDCFDVASTILVEAYHSTLYNGENQSDNLVLASWMKTLVVCCCYLRNSPEIQLLAVKTFLDLLNYPKSQPEVGEEPSLRLQFLHAKTHVVNVVTDALWNHLQLSNVDLQIKSIKLLYELQILFHFDDCVERMIGEFLLNGDETTRLNALYRFIALYTIGRDIQEAHAYRCFQSCILRVLDHLLQTANSPLRLRTATWLSQAMLHGGLSRILDPLLLILLDPSTARFGILHVSIEPSLASPNISDNNIKNSSSEVIIPTSFDGSNKVYAISSIDGHVIYHVSEQSKGRCKLLVYPQSIPNSVQQSTGKPRRNFPRKLKWRWKKEKELTIDDSLTTSTTSNLLPLSIAKSKSDSHLRLIAEENFLREIELPRLVKGHISVVVNPLNENIAQKNTENDEEMKDYTNILPDKDPIELLRFARLYNPSRKANFSNAKGDATSKFASQENLLPSNQLQDFDESLCADEYFEKNDNYDDTSSSLSSIISGILTELLDGVVRKCESAKEIQNPSNALGIHPLHSHLLLYCGVYDSSKILYAFNTLKNLMRTNPRLFLCCASTSGIVCASMPQDILYLLARHRKSVFGRNFEGDLSSAQEYISTYRSSMYLEVLVSVALHFARSFYPNLGLPKLIPDVLEGNRLVQLTSIETLRIIFEELIPIVQDSGRGFANYISDMLMRCKVQKIVLHCAMASISYIQQQQSFTMSSSDNFKTFTEDIIEFNDPFTGTNVMTEHSRAVQIQVIKLLLNLIKLEYHVESQKNDSSDCKQANNLTKDGNMINQETGYATECLIPQQPMFVRVILGALVLKGSMRYLHNLWTDLITASLPYLGQALPEIVLVVIRQLCLNIELLADEYLNPLSDEELPPDYIISQLEALTMLCHYCILDSTLQISPLANNGGLSTINQQNSSPQILSNLVHVFTTLPLIQELSKEKNDQLEALLAVRRRVLGNMPRVITSLAALWMAITSNNNVPVAEISLWGSPRVVRTQILEFLSPISLHHGPTFLASVAVVWQERRNPNHKQVLPIPTAHQLILVDLLSSIKEMHIDNLVQTVHQVVKQTPSVEGDLQEVSLTVSVLELFFVYMKNATGDQLAECWTSLLVLLKDGSSLPPPALLLVLAILNEFVQKCPPFSEKKDQRDLQDITAKLVEACGDVAGACLEQTTWLRKNLSVKDVGNIDEDSSSGLNGQQDSVNAQWVLAQILAPLLDVSYGSQEKEKVAQMLITLMYKITPYLKNHSAKYASSFLACSQLLANLSGFQYTRKAWKRDAFELLLDPALFQMDIECLPCWTVIIDNLMTHDMTTFRDLTSRISVAQSGSYSLFSSREQEYEQRAQLLKRLAFVIMCSETDQYHKFMINVQERLAESLRLPQVVPSIQAQVFFCFRVLLLRMSSHHVTSLWPSIISELVQVFVNIEKELTTETEEFSSHIKLMSGLDSSWVVNSNNGLHANGHPHWLLLTLSAAKLLDLAVLLPAHMLPQFQMYKWAFVGDSSCNHDFVPYVNRIARLMTEKFGPCKEKLAYKEGELLLTESLIDNLQQLQPFFEAIGSRHASGEINLKSIEKHILKDFLDKMITSPVH